MKWFKVFNQRTVLLTITTTGAVELMIIVNVYKNINTVIDN